EGSSTRLSSNRIRPRQRRGILRHAVADSFCRLPGRAKPPTLVAERAAEKSSGRRQGLMWGRIITVLLLTGVGGAQSVTSADSTGIDRQRSISARSSTIQPEPEGRRLLVLAYQRYNGLRRGRDQEIAVVVCMVPGKFRYCPDFANPVRSDLAPVAFQLSP